MIDCPNGEMRDRLPDLLHDRLDPAERLAVEAHLRECAPCRDELALLREMSRAMHRAPAIAVRDIVAALPAYRTPARRSWGGWRAAAAIAFLAAGGTTIAVARHDRAVPVESASVAAAQELIIGSATIADLSDSELSALVKDIETLDAVTPADVDRAVPPSPIAPSGAGA